MNIQKITLLLPLDPDTQSNKE
uniref:Uncharacterized protein n=1 Tax=Arundo donax TaxID=35708 RepID=A0A0A8YJ24_ARUDO